MTDDRKSFFERLPYVPTVADDAKKRRTVLLMQVGAYCLLAAAIILPIAQFQQETAKNNRNVAKIAEYDAAIAKYNADVAAGVIKEGDPNNLPPGRPKIHKGAIGRWKFAILDFWQGKNIYGNPMAADAGEGDDEGSLHPNMPFTIIVLTPFAFLPVLLMAITFNLIKAAVLIASILMAVSIANDGRRKMPDWVVLLGFLWAATFLAGDIKHGNTNVFVVGAIVLHLWLFRRGRDFWAGWSLVLAICLKMTPALFLLYWAYQRNWKLLVGAIAALIVFVAVIPTAALAPAYGVDHAWKLTSTWFDNLIKPGLIKGAWYPIHVNQSAPAVFGRYLIDGQYGDIFWNPDDHTDYDVKLKAVGPAENINVLSLDPKIVKRIIQCFQAAIVLIMAFAIGWRKLPRDDGRRSLHYAMVVAAMLLLNQRTWNHHAGILLIAGVAIWYAIAFGVMSRAVRLTCIIMMIAAGLAVWLTGSEIFKLAGKIAGVGGKVSGHWADVFDAYGPSFLHFLLVFASAATLAIALKRKDAPYADVRQKL